MTPNVTMAAYGKNIMVTSDLMFIKFAPLQKIDIFFVFADILDVLFVCGSFKTVAQLYYYISDKTVML